MIRRPGKPILVVLVALALPVAAWAEAGSPAGAGQGSAPAATGAAAPPARGMPPNTFFREHSFDFPSEFRVHHPGPSWMLLHAADLQLTAAQTDALKRLQAGMRQSVTRGSDALKQAYATYGHDAEAETPSTARMLQDVKAVGAAQTRLAGAMIPYHLQAYRVLTPSQQATYRRMVAAGP